MSAGPSPSGADRDRLTLQLSVCICTHGRPDGVGRVLDDLASETAGSQWSWEVVVVDNAPSADTRREVERRCGALPLRYVAEPQVGLCQARNRVISESSGEVVWFLDDDVRLEPGWLRGVADAVANRPACSYFGGRVIPDWLGASPPGWLAIAAEGPASHAGTYLSNDYGPGLLPIEGPIAVMGANMGFRRDVFDRHGGFRVDLDPAGSRHRLGGDTEFWERLRDAGEAGTYVGGASVRHITPASRLTRRYALSWSYHHGWSAGRRKAVRMARAGTYSLGARVGELSKDLAKLVAAGAASTLAAATGRSARTMASWMRLAYRAGRVVHDFGPAPDMSLDHPWRKGASPAGSVQASGSQGSAA